MKFRFPTLDIVVKSAMVGAILFGLAAGARFLSGPRITVIGNHPIEQKIVSPLTGLPCLDPSRRPVAVMVSSDPQARPLSGLANADMVFEMPVTPDGITRMMAVFQCQDAPKEIGSIRSARQDFIPLAQGLDAVYAHWGGEHGALEQLNSHVIDNVNALLYDGTVFYRKKGIPRPHDGFSTLDLIQGQATKLNYTLTATISGYAHESERASSNLGDLVDHVSIPWPGSMAVEYRYDDSTNSYARWRGGKPEMDAPTDKQVHAGVVVVMETESSFLREQYITVRTTGQGVATIYQDGHRITAHWSKPGPTDMLTFTDTHGRPVALAPGAIWVEIIAP